MITSKKTWARGLKTYACLVLAGCVSAAGCAKNPAQPTTPPPASFGPPELACPSNITLPVTGSLKTVPYPTPTIGGGMPPVVVACTPQSGASFSLGNTTVTCTATDARRQQASCSFQVTLTAILSRASTFLAFGDSVTEGENGLEGPGAARVQWLDLDHAYPTVLQSLLKTEFPTQNIRVINEGRGGERASEGTTRLPAVLDRHRPDSVLFLEGYNDLIHDGGAAAGPIADAIRQDIRIARDRGIQFIFVSTLTPPGPGRRMLSPAAIVDTNSRIAKVVADELAVLVNPYDAFLGQESRLVADGLHLTPDGYHVLAEKFFAAIRDSVASQPIPSASTSHHPPRLRR
ncbi:MAG TPA: GDSL-type esterase/lipase family protein [Vicinamibacterales bacterium]|nr:GDSL-type esterase/lipase family protein [Vicinamibacterales bacterium]